MPFHCKPLPLHAIVVWTSTVAFLFLTHAFCHFFPSCSEGRRLKPHTLMAMVQNLLYERRFGPYFVEPVIAGLDPTTKEPYICALDLIGCACEPADFVVSGTCSESLYGTVIVIEMVILSLCCYRNLALNIVENLFILIQATSFLSQRTYLLSIWISMGL